MFYQVAIGYGVAPRHVGEAIRASARFFSIKLPCCWAAAQFDMKNEEKTHSILFAQFIVLTHDLPEVARTTGTIEVSTMLNRSQGRDVLTSQSAVKIDRTFLIC